jgi:hypothetical protein
MPEIYIHAVKGRTLDQKRALVKDITDAVVKNFSVPVEAVTLVQQAGSIGEAGEQGTKGVARRGWPEVGLVEASRDDIEEAARGGQMRGGDGTSAFVLLRIERLVAELGQHLQSPGWPMFCA